MPVVTQIIGNNVTIVYTNTYQLCQTFAAQKRKEHPRVKYEVRSSEAAVKHKPILKS